MDPFTALAIGSTLLGAAGTLGAGKAARRAAELNAYNIETERELSKAQTLQRHNDRLEQYRSNLSANIAAFSAMGRDIGGQDRSVAAFLEKQKRIAADDTARSDFMGMMDQMKMTAQAAATRTEGRAVQASATIQAFTSLAQGLYQYNVVRTPTATKPVGYVPPPPPRP